MYLVVLSVSTGPRCIMSIYSAPGLAWVKDRVGIIGIEDSIAHFAATVTQRLKISSGSTRIRAAEPNSREAWGFSAGTIQVESILSLLTPSSIFPFCRGSWLWHRKSHVVREQTPKISRYNWQGTSRGRVLVCSAEHHIRFWMPHRAPQGNFVFKGR